VIARVGEARGAPFADPLESDLAGTPKTRPSKRFQRVLAAARGGVVRAPRGETEFAVLRITPAVRRWTQRYPFLDRKRL
jgi:hypothetical protein